MNKDLSRIEHMLEAIKYCAVSKLDPSSIPNILARI